MRRYRTSEPNGYCQNPECGKSIEPNRVYCCNKCGLRGRYLQRYSGHVQKRYGSYGRRASEPVPAKVPHIRCYTPHICCFTAGVCVQCRKEKNLADFEQNKAYVWGAELRIPHGSFVTKGA
jgi:hypothetical protein